MSALIPNSTQIPNILLDFVIPNLPEAEGKCLFYICRRTFGFQKESDRISFSQFIDGLKTRDNQILDYGTGLSRASVFGALRNLEYAGAIIVEKKTSGNVYKINMDMDAMVVVQNLNQFRIHTKSSSKLKPKQVQLLNLQYKGKQRKEKKEEIEIKTADSVDKLWITQITPFLGKYAPSMIEKFTLLYRQKDKAGVERWRAEKYWDMEKRLEMYKIHGEDMERDRGRYKNS